ncbi:uncharacterized protein ACNLHF_001543 isoform 2-T2 [Anomaloglossus baeobatrachus]
MHMSTSTEAAGEEAWREAEVQEQQVLEMSSLVLMVKMMLLLLAQIFPSTFFYRILIFWAGKEKKKKREWVESIMERQQTSTERDASCASGGRWLVTLKKEAPKTHLLMLYVYFSLVLNAKASSSVATGTEPGFTVLHKKQYTASRLPQHALKSNVEKALKAI